MSALFHFFDYAAVLILSRIPFERALDFANREKITEKLYPLFVHNISALLYHPQNAGRSSISAPAMAAQQASLERRREGHPDYMRTPQTSGPPALQHHHSMANPTGAAQQGTPHSAGPHPASGRPGLDRAHTFPTPPTSASSMMGMGNSDSSYGWNGQAVSAPQSSQPLTIDTGLSNARSVPTTPASTPPGSMGGMPAYQTSGPYDAPRPMYTHSSQSSIGSQYGGLPRYPPNSGIKSEMGPPPRAIHDSEDKRDMYGQSQEHPPSSDAAEGEHEGDYTHSAGPYGHRNPYAYNPHSAPAVMHQEQSHVSPDMTGSPTKGQGRATPRSATAYGAYSAPQRSQQLPSSNLYNVMSENRPPNGNDMYSASYAQQSYGAPNGMPASNKRGYEMDDDDQNGLKRQKTIHDRNLAPMMAAQNKR